MQSKCLSRCGNTSYITETGSITTSHIIKPLPHLVYIRQHFQMQRVKIFETEEKFGKTDSNTKSFIFVWSKVKSFILFFSHEFHLPLCLFYSLNHFLLIKFKFTHTLLSKKFHWIILTFTNQFHEFVLYGQFHLYGQLLTWSI